MSDAVATMIAATEASAASANTEEPKVAPPTTEGSAVETQLPAEGQPETEAPVATEAAVEEEPNLEEAPETSGDFAKYKHLFAENPELRHIVGREKAFSELGPFSEVREIVQRIPSIEDAQVLVDQAENLKVLSDTLRNSPSEFAERLAEIDPNAYQKLIEHVTSDEVLQQVAPQVLQNRVEHMNNRIIEATWNWVKEHGTDEEKQAVQIFARLRGYRPTAATPVAQASPELEKLRKEKQDRERADSESAFSNFWQQTDSAVVNQSVEDIQTAIKKAFPQVEDEQLQLMTVEAFNKVKAAVHAQPQTAAQLERFRTDARKRQDIATHKAIVDFMLARNRKQIPFATKDVVTRWTTKILKLNNTQIDKKREVANRTRDVGVGVNGSTSTSAGAPEKPGPKTLKSVWARLDGDVAKLRSGATR